MDAGHHHHHGPVGAHTTPRTHLLLGGAVLVLLLAAVVGAVVLRPHGERPVLGEELGFSGELVHATVDSIADRPCAGTAEADGIRCTRLGIRLTSGPTEGEQGRLEIPKTDSSLTFHEGDRIVVQYTPDNPPRLRYFFQDFQRATPLTALVVIFAVAVILLGRWQGLRALAALVATVGLLFWFAFPAIIDGHDPTAVALVTAVFIAVVALYVTHGVTEMITVALLGTFAALAATATLAVVFTHLAHFTGFGSEDAFYLQLASAQIDVKGLVLAGIIVGSLGVLDDVTVTQASAVWQLHAANPGLGAAGLYRSAVTIGRDHIASTVNTLVLAYAGASLPLLLVFAQAGRPVSQVITSEVIAVEVVRTLVGSIGLVAAVPITTALAAVVITRGSVRGLATPRPERRRLVRARSTPDAGAGPADPPQARWEMFGPEEDPGR